MKKYTTHEINSNWKIKIYGIIDGVRVNKLVGVAGLVRYIGEELAQKFVGRAFRDMLDKCVCKLRRGIKITFYAF